MEETDEEIIAEFWNLSSSPKAVKRYQQDINHSRAVRKVTALAKLNFNEGGKEGTRETKER